MLEERNEKDKQLTIEDIKKKEKDKEIQNDINNKLEQISKRIKEIPNIGLKYMEYISALIYAIYESKIYTKNKEYIQQLDILYIINTIDYILNKIIEKERSRNLFINIRFNEIINERLKEVITEICELMSKIDKLEGDTKSILAEAFEYLIMKSASNGEISFKKGEFYTPKGLVKTMVKLLDIKPNMSIYNPSTGTGNFIIESAKYCKEIYVFGEEENISNYNICITNLWLHNIYNKRIKENKEEKIQLVDRAIANPPFVQDSENYINSIYYKIPAKSNYIKYLEEMINSLQQDGKMAIVLPHGFLFKKANLEYFTREKLIKNNYIDAIISLPEKLFYNTKIPVIILLINKKRERNEVLFIDASKEYTKKRKTNILTIENQDKIVKTYKNFEEIYNYSNIVTIEEIRKNNYDLNIKKYIQIQNKIEEIDKEKIEEKIYSLEQERYKLNKEINNLIKNM